MPTRQRDSDFTAGPRTARDDGQGRQPGGETSAAQGEVQQPVPRMPHERDESSDQQAPQAPSMARIGRQAHADLVRGVPDTSRSVEMDATYHRLREADAPAAAPQEPVSPAAPPASRR